MVRDERAGGRESSQTEYPEDGQACRADFQRVGADLKVGPYHVAPISTALMRSRFSTP